MCSVEALCTRATAVEAAFFFNLIYFLSGPISRLYYEEQPTTLIYITVNVIIT